MTTTIKLTRPIEGPDGEIKEIKLREPLAGDIRKIGSPFSIVNGSTTVDDARICDYISRLGGIAPVFIDKLCAADYLPLMTNIAGFFSASETNSSN